MHYSGFTKTSSALEGRNIQATTPCEGERGSCLVDVEILARFMKGVEAMNAAMNGNDVRIFNDHVRVSFDVPLGENPDDFFEKAKRAYIEKIDEVRRKLGGCGK